MSIHRTCFPAWRYMWATLQPNWTYWRHDTAIAPMCSSVLNPVRLKAVHLPWQCWRSICEAVSDASPNFPILVPLHWQYWSVQRTDEKRVILSLHTKNSKFRTLNQRTVAEFSNSLRLFESAISTNLFRFVWCPNYRNIIATATHSASLYDQFIQVCIGRKQSVTHMQVYRLLKPNLCR